MTSGTEIVEKEIVLQSVPSNIVHIEPFIDSFRCELGIGDEIYGNMLVCITEAVNNAILHGNHADGNKNVAVNLRKNRNMVTCIIRDEGDGFDFNNLPDPTAPENIENAGGRGIFLMKHLSDFVIFSNDGTNVEIQFRV